MFPLVLLQAKVVGFIEYPILIDTGVEFPLVLLQAKVVGMKCVRFQGYHFGFH